VILKNILLEHYRNYTRQNIDFNTTINLFLGKNAQGKTNFLEAVYYLSTGRAFRNSKDLELINWHNDFFRISCNLYKKNINREFKIEIYYDRDGNKQIKINGVKYRKISDLFGFLQVVIFSPDDLTIIKGGPAERRKYIDLEICQVVKGYYNVLLSYNKVLMQRNNLLKDIKNNLQKQDSLEVWNQQLIKFGSIIIKNRIEFLKKVVPLARKAQEEITLGKEKIDIKYSSSVINKPVADLEEIGQQFRDIINKNTRQEILRSTTLYGPHRDDLIFYLNDKDLKTFGSQGQQRTAILALKIAELKMYYAINGEYPLLLLDDVMSELDDYRREFLLKLINNNNIQTLITGANMDLIETPVENMQVFNVENGTIKGAGRE